METINIKQSRKMIADYIEKVALDDRVIDALRYKDMFLPKECELWDYKREANADSVPLGETVLQVVSFYNSYGGYIIYGVDEIAKDQEYIPVGISRKSLNIQQINQLIFNYTGDQIDASYVEIPYIVGGKEFLFGVLHIPKRPPAVSPVFFGKNGPEKEKGQPIFTKDTAYIRMLDSCIPVSSKEHLQFIFGERTNPFLWDIDNPLHLTKRSIIVEHNLPDRNFICPQFIGRDQIIQELWKWLGDEFANVKVLAGDGGKGKTSIAYEFAEEVCRIRPFDIQKVVWLTAKSKQFVGFVNEFVNVPQTHYDDSESLLKVLCSELAILDKEIANASISMLRKLIKNALSLIPCLIVIDDVDSTELDEQRRISEIAMQFPGSQARFLLTTRMNLSSSRAMCIPIGGFDKDDYREYVKCKLDEFGCGELIAKKVELMHRVTDGSPLFTDSLLRLYRLGMPIDNAIKKWQGQLGSEVRKAALQREIEKLTPESRRILLACSYMGDTSLTELKQATGYDNERMQLCINELSSLFLISARKIIEKESRFTISNNTARLVLENKEMLVPDPTALQKMVSRLSKSRGKIFGKAIYAYPIGAAIKQAIALLREERYDEAIETAEAALQQHKNNPGLILMRGRCLFEKYRISKENKYLDMARRSFNKAHTYGQRRDVLYHLWYESEHLANDSNGAVEVASLAINDEIPLKSEWLQRRALSNISLSRALKGALNIDGAIEKLKDSAQDISQALELAKPLKQIELAQIFYRVDDELWRLAEANSYDIIGFKDLFDITRLLIKRGDRRFINYERLVYALNKTYEGALKNGKIPKSRHAFLRGMLKDTKIQLRILKNNVDKDDEVERVSKFESNLAELETTIGE